MVQMVEGLPTDRTACYRILLRYKNIHTIRTAFKPKPFTAVQLKSRCYNQGYNFTAQGRLSIGSSKCNVFKGQRDNAFEINYYKTLDYLYNTKSNNLSFPALLKYTVYYIL